MKKMIFIFFIYLGLGCEKYSKNETVITGKVIDKNGNGKKGVIVSFFGYSTNGFFKQYETLKDTISTDSNGVFNYKKIILRPTISIEVS